MSFGEKVKAFFKKLIAVIIVVALLAGSGTVALVYFDKADIPVIEKILVAVGAKKNESEENENKDDVETSDDGEDDEEKIDFAVPYEPPVLDAENIINQYGTITEKIAVTDAYKTILSESAASDLFAERGFEENPVTTDFKINGEYIGECEISYYSDDQHPTYQYVYQTASGEIWIVSYMNGNFIAVASSHNIENNTEPEIILAQSDTLTNYDNNSNQYFNYIPDASKIKIIKVSAINAETLENYKF